METERQPGFGFCALGIATPCSSHVKPSSEVAYQIEVPAAGSLQFRTALSSEVWVPEPKGGDGVQFDVFIEDHTGRTHVFSEFIDPVDEPTDRHWHDHRINLSAWAGERVTLILATDPGPQNNADFDWAGWGTPQVGQLAAFDFAQKFYLADPPPDDLDTARVMRTRIDGSWQDVLFQHPPSQLTYPVLIGPGSILSFGFGLDPEVWSEDKGDGVQFEVTLSSDAGGEVLFSSYIDPKTNFEERRNYYENIDLSQYAGQAVEITFATSPGPNNHTAFDWAYWIAPVLVEQPVE